MIHANPKCIQRHHAGTAAAPTTPTTSPGSSAMDSSTKLAYSLPAHVLEAQARVAISLLEGIRMLDHCQRLTSRMASCWG